MSQNRINSQAANNEQNKKKNIYGKIGEKNIPLQKKNEKTIQLQNRENFSNEI